MFFIHGGAFITGDIGPINGSVLAANKDVIVVTANYRLGALGFLAHPEMTSGGSATGNTNVSHLTERSQEFIKLDGPIPSAL